jgi:hypothetical protein
VSNPRSLPIDAFVEAQTQGTPFHRTGWLLAGVKGCGQKAHYLTG